jgi:hypothetical protein
MTTSVKMARLLAHVCWTSRSSRRRSWCCCGITPSSTLFGSQRKVIQPTPTTTSPSSYVSLPSRRLDTTTKSIGNYASSTNLVNEVLSEKSIQTFNYSDVSLVVIQKDISARNRGWALYAKQDIPRGARVFHARSLKTYYDNNDEDEVNNSFTSKQR